MNRKEYMKIYNKKYTRTVKGLVKKIYAHQIRNTKHREHELPKYTEQELHDWFIKENSKSCIYENWINSGYDKELIPSIDRLINTETYSLDNIQLVTWKRNKELADEGIRNGSIQNSTLLNNGLREVVQIDLFGNIVNEFISFSEATRATGIDHRGISDVCRNIRKTFHGFIWVYKDKLKDLALSNNYLELLRKKRNNAKPIMIELCFNDGTSTILSTKKCAELLNISTHNVRKIAKGEASKKSPKLPNNITKLTIKEV